MLFGITKPIPYENVINILIKMIYLRMITIQINHSRLKSLHKIASDFDMPHAYSQKAAKLYNKYCKMIKDIYISQPYSSPYRNVGNYESQLK